MTARTYTMICQTLLLPFWASSNNLMISYCSGLLNYVVEKYELVAIVLAFMSTNTCSYSISQYLICQ